MTAIADYYGKTLSIGVIDIYWKGLLNFPIEGVETAFGRHLQSPDNGQFMPKIADVIRMLEGTSADSAARAWSKVDKAVRVIGTYRDVVFDDAIIHRVIHDMGGWISLGMKQDNEWPFIAKDFESRYRSYKSRSETPEYHSVLTGIAGLENEKNGFKKPDPILIGDDSIAKRVMQGGATIMPIISMQSAAFSIPVIQPLKKIA